MCSLGLGHATRSMPLIKKLMEEGHEVIIISHGRALTLLKKEFPDIRAYDLKDFPVKYSEKAHQFIPYFLVQSNKILKTLISSHQTFLKIHERENFDIIISDSRFDIFHRSLPSFLITHQLRVMVPGAGELALFYHYNMGKYFTKFIVPDFEKDSLSGEMSHELRLFPMEKISYIGPLSPFRRREIQRDIDVMISISGPEPQRTLLEKSVLAQLDSLTGNVIVTLGKPESDITREGKIYGYLTTEKREELMNRSKLIISRSGYSTIMDLYVIGGKAMFIPTPGQPEQEYLARYLEKKGVAGYTSQDNLDLKNLVERAKYYEGFKGGYDVSKSVENFLRVISEWS